MKSQHIIVMLGAMLLLISVILPFASALTDSDADYLIKQYSSFDIQRPCFYNDSWCGPTAVCNMTISSTQGNGSVMYNNVIMTNQITYHNLTLKAADTKIAGWYQATMTCEDRGDAGFEVFYFRITQTGDESNTSIFIIIGVVAALIIVGGYLARNEYIVFIGGIAMTFLGMYTMIYGFSGTANDFTRAIAAIACGLGIIFLIQPAYSLIENSGETGYEIVEEVSSE